MDFLQEDLHHKVCLPGLLQPELLLQQQDTADLHRRHSFKFRSGSASVGCLGPGVHKVFLSPLRVSSRYGVLILIVILLLLPSCWGFSFALGCGVSFFGGIQHSPVDDGSAVSCNFGVLLGEDEHTSSTLPSWSVVGCRLFPFIILNISCQFLLVCRIFPEKIS